MSTFVNRFVIGAVTLVVVFACTEEPRNTEPLVDPWLRERTPVNLRLESQIGAAVIPRPCVGESGHLQPGRRLPGRNLLYAVSRGR